jgi:hypothetical protein
LALIIPLLIWEGLGKVRKIDKSTLE